MDKSAYHQPTTLWTLTFESDDYQRAPSIGGLRAAFHERSSITMKNLRPAEHDILSDYDNLDENFFENVELQTMGKRDDEDDDISNLNRVHSIHRNRLKNNKRSNVEASLEARVGSFNARTFNRNQAINMQECIENHADLIVAKMEQDALLMEDDPESEELRKEMLRDMPQCLTLKRCVKEKLSKSVSQKSKRKPLGCFKMFKYRMSMAVSNFKLSIKNLAYSLELWYGTVKQIEGNFGSGVASYFKFLRWMFLMNVFMAVISFSFIVVPQISFGLKNNTFIEDFSVEDIFTGEGYLTNTFLFYGFYSNQSVSQSVLTYSMPDAYFFTMVFLYLCCFAALSISVAFSYRRNFIETEEGLKNIFANKIFCGWDYNIATPDAAKLKSRTIYNELTELLYDVMYQSEKDSCTVMFWTINMQITMHILVCLSMAGSGYLMWFLMTKSTVEHWLSIYSALAINVIMTFLPIVFSWVVQYEGYKNPRTKLILTLARTFVLGFVIIGVLITFWLKNPSEDQCWETRLGQEIYRLILFDFVFSVLVSPTIDLISYCCCRLMCDNRIRFDIARNTMQVIYNQTLFWVGLFFSPFLAVIVVIKLLLTWYIRKILVVKFCQPPSKSWRAAQTTTWFLMMSFLSLLLVVAVLGYIITSTATTECGPFRNYKYIYEIVTVGVLQLRKGSDVWNILLYITRPGFIALVLIALGGRVYYLRARAHAQRGVVAIYREMLLWEARDKEFLLEKIALITKGVWQYKLQEGRTPDPMILHQGNPRLRAFQGNFRRDSIRSSFASSVAGPSLIDDIDVQSFRYRKNS